MEKAKGILLEGIEDVKEKEVDRLEELQEEVKGCNDKVGLFGKIIDIYGNTLEQRPVAVKYLKEVLEDDFFKKAEVKAGLKGVEFSTEEYVIRFPLSRVKVIEVEDLKNANTPKGIERDMETLKYKHEWYIEALDLLVKYLKNKTVTNLKRLKEHEENAKFWGLGALSKFDDKKLPKYVKLYKYYNSERIDKFAQSRDSYLRIYLELKELVKENNKKVDASVDYIGTINDLKDFEEAGYTIKVITNVEWRD